MPGLQPESHRSSNQEQYANTLGAQLPLSRYQMAKQQARGNQKKISNQQVADSEIALARIFEMPGLQPESHRSSNQEQYANYSGEIRSVPAPTIGGRHHYEDPQHSVRTFRTRGESRHCARKNQIDRQRCSAVTRVRCAMQAQQHQK